MRFMSGDISSDAGLRLQNDIPLGPAASCGFRYFKGILLKSCMLGRKVIYLKCINFSYNNMTKGIRPLDKKAILAYTGKITYT